MLVTTRYCVIGESVVEFITKVGDSNTITQEFNILLPEKLEPPAVEKAETPPLEIELTAATPDTVVEQAPEVVAQPLGSPLELSAEAPPLTRKKRGLQALIRGAYTALFTLLGMAGAAFAYLQDNLSQLSDLSLKTVGIVLGGALLAGFGYFLKRYYKPDGLL